MADANINALEVPVVAASPPTRSDEQILPRNNGVPVGKSNYFLDVERTQANPIFKIAILWGVVNRANIDYAERIWEEFTQCIHSFIEDRMNLALHAEGKKKVNPLVILASKISKSTSSHPPKPAPAPAKPQEKKREVGKKVEKFLGCTSGVTSTGGKSGKPELKKYEPLPEVQGKGKEKVGQAGSDPGKQVEDQAGSDPGKQVEGQAGSDPGVAADSQIQPSHVVHAGPNLEHMNLEVSDTST
ncbi:hypothetical protein Tco_0991284 [Tanacetum coccineum]|uniref:Uncharacterized protein n=1 Tax=Tanacetum coccineum TaxID=301880 RepID=A0ABQ5EZ30_9ASTR